MRAQGRDTHHAVEPNSTKKQFGIHKASQGTSFVDPKYRDRIQKDYDDGLLVGAYHWLETEAKFPAVDQALHFAETIEGTPYDFIAVDFENYLNPVYRGDDYLRYFFTTLKDITKRKLIYTNQNTWYTHNMVNYKNLWQGPQWILEMGIELWVAHWYQPNPSPIKPWGIDWAIWQTGIENGNDQDLFNGDFEFMKLWAGRIPIIETGNGYGEVEVVLDEMQEVIDNHRE